MNSVRVTFTLPREDFIFIEKASGKDFKRPEYQLLKRMLRPNDVLYVKSLDRLGRNKQMILDEWKDITKNKKKPKNIVEIPPIAIHLVMLAFFSILFLRISSSFLSSLSSFLLMSDINTIILQNYF